LSRDDSKLAGDPDTVYLHRIYLPSHNLPARDLNARQDPIIRLSRWLSVRVGPIMRVPPRSAIWRRFAKCRYSRKTDTVKQKPADHSSCGTSLNGRRTRRRTIESTAALASTKQKPLSLVGGNLPIFSSAPRTKPHFLGGETSSLSVSFLTTNTFQDTYRDSRSKVFVAHILASQFLYNPQYTAYWLICCQRGCRSGTLVGSALST
jgi:hypothetical protein